MILPGAAPAPSLSITPQTIGLMQRSCRSCEVLWMGELDDTCWLCDNPGQIGGLRAVHGKGKNDGATNYREAELRRRTT